MRDNTRRFSVFKCVAQTIGWMFGIKRDIGSPHFKHCSHCDRHIDASVNANGDSITCDNIVLKQQLRQAVRSFIDIAIAKKLVADNNRPCFRRPCGAFEKMVNATISIMLHLGVIPIFQ